MKKILKRILTSNAVAVLVLICLTGCGATQTKYQREYAKVWNELIKTQAWKESLMARNSDTNEDFYASNDNEGLFINDSKMDVRFEDKYQALVSKAYFKIITEAEKADARISAEYQLLQEETESGKGNKREVVEITKKYEAHRAMLSGLKSWNIFSENRTGDLDYFMAENEEVIQKMLRSRESDDQMINYLIYKLADLYHVEEK
jgi:hypothetical protein